MKKQLKGILALTMAIVMLLALTACGNSAAPATEQQTSGGAQTSQTETAETAVETRVLKLSHDNSENSLWQKCLEIFADEVYKNSGGALKIEIYSGGQLGDIATICESLMVGNVDFCLNGAGYLGNYSSAYMLLEVPFIFDSYEHLDAALYGEAGAIGEAELEQAGLKVVSYWHRGERQIMSTMPINSAADLNGLKIRVPEIDTYVSCFAALGCNPTPITWNDVFTSAQQGIIEAVENPLSTMYDASLQEALPYCAITNHCYSAAAFFTGTKTWNSLTPEQQQIILDAAQTAKLVNDQTVATESQDYAAKLESEGYTVTYPDTTEMRAICAGVYDKLAAQYNEAFYQAIVAAKP